VDPIPSETGGRVHLGDVTWEKGIVLRRQYIKPIEAYAGCHVDVGIASQID